MSCDSCNSNRLVNVSGKCSDMCNISYKQMERDDDVPRDMEIGGGDYLEFTYCLDCGKIQGNFPIDDPAWYQKTQEGREEEEEDIENGG